MSGPIVGSDGFHTYTITFSPGRTGGIQIAGGPAAAQEALRLQRAINRAMGAVVSEITAVNERGGLMYNPDRVNQDIGSVVRSDGSGDFEHSTPDTAAPRGLEQIERGFAGGLQPITHASALVIGLPLGDESALTSQRARFEALSRQIGGPVIVRAMRSGNTTYKFSANTAPLRVK
jgi:hypothetical protein